MYNCEMYIYFVIVKLTIISWNNPVCCDFFPRFNFGLTPNRFSLVKILATLHKKAAQS